jgi:hypothetical protein
MFGSAECSLWRAEVFFCSLDDLYGGLGISELQFLLKKILNVFQLDSKYFLVIKTLDPDPKHCIEDQRNFLEKSGKVGTVQGRKTRSFIIENFFLRTKAEGGSSVQYL